MTQCNHYPSYLDTNENQGIETSICIHCAETISRFYIYDDYDQLPFYTEWATA